MLKTLFIVANWKSNETILQAEEWFRTINNSLVTFNKEEERIIICPPFTLLPIVSSEVKSEKLGVKLGAQDISPFGEGAYTGEINGRQIKEFADYVLIGHCERRTNFKEDNDLLTKKILMAKKYLLEPIFFIQNEATFIPQSISMVVYEPPSSISPGPSDTPENAQKIAQLIKKRNNIQYVLYGGNVTSKNVFGFCQMPSIDGVLVGRASLDAQEFYKIIQNA